MVDALLEESSNTRGYSEVFQTKFTESSHLASKYSQVRFKVMSCFRSLGSISTLKCGPNIS
jgi:hypothetical protein